MDLSWFELRSGTIAIGDPTMEMAHYKLTGLDSGLYQLTPGALAKPKRGARTPRGRLIDLDSACVYVVDVEKLENFEEEFHAFGNKCDYDMSEMEKLHRRLEKRVGVRVGFYWVDDLEAEAEEKYVLIVRRIEAKDS